MINFTLRGHLLYKQLRYEIISKVEGIRKKPYPDSKGIPTIGIGFNLRDINVRKAVLKALDFDKSDSSDTAYIKQIEDSINDHANNVITWTKLINNLNAVMVSKTGNQNATFKLNNTQIRKAFDTLVEEYEGRVNKWLAGIPESKGRAVLVSMAWNGWINKGKCPSLRKAVVSGNRAEAWYEIRYNTNPTSNTAATRRNFATRHYYESEVFGLYDAGGSGNIGAAAAKQTYAMYTKHRKKILGYENAFGEGKTGTGNRREKANSIYKVGNLVKSIEQSFNPAFTYLKTNYLDTLKNPVTIDYRDVQVGSNKTDNLNGTIRNKYTLGSGKNQNDLILGEGGNDNISGGKGDDVLYGGEGTDVIYGGIGNDQIFGGKNKDTIYGDGGEDYIEGGEDKDIIHGGLDDDILKGGEGADEIYGDGNDDEIYGGAGNDKLYGGLNTDVIYGGDDNDEIEGNEGKDYLFGEDGEDNIKGGAGDDWLLGGKKNDTLYGGIGKDTLKGEAGNDNLYGNDDNEQDTLKGGIGYDTYHAGDNDIINDADQSGRVIFEGSSLSHGVKKDNQDYYKGDGGKYRLNGNTLTFTKNNKKVTIKNYTKGALGITLEEAKDPEPDDKNPLINQNFSSPLVLDLNDNGKTSTSIFESDTHFDLDGDGYKEKTGWVEGEDGILALDKNQNNRIDNGNELFGNNTLDKDGNPFKDGFAALASHDKNKDGKIDSNDDIYDALKVWQDKNHDGVSQADELKSLQALNIESINLDPSTSRGIEEFNKITHESTFVQNNEEKAIRDVWFNRNTQDTTYDFNSYVPWEIRTMPEIRGKGRVKNLSHAMTEDPALKQKVKTFLSGGSTNLNNLYARAKEILALWTHNDHIDPDKARGTQYILNHNYANPQIKYMFREYAKARDIAILESFAGKEFTMTVDGKKTSDIIGTTMARSMQEKSDYLRDTVVITLLAQSLFGRSIYNAGTDKLNRTEVLNRIASELTTGSDINRRNTAGNLLSALINRDHLTVFSIIDPALLNNQNVRQALIKNNISLALDAGGDITGTIRSAKYYGKGNDNISGSGEIHGGAGNDTIQGVGSRSHDVIYGGKGDDIINGGQGSDIIYGGDGNDTLNGGSGSDILFGGEGDDTIYAGDGYGHDILSGGTGNDTLTGNYRSSTYVYQYGDGHDTIYDSGSIGTTPDVLILNGLDRDDIKIEKQGNDLILKIRAFPELEYDFGSIFIKDGFGRGKIEQFQFEDQTLDFNQLLNGSDVYDTIHTYALSQGKIVIHDTGGTDTLAFGEGITQADLIVKTSKDNNDIIIGIKEDGVEFDDITDSVRIKNYDGKNSRIETCRYAGEIWRSL